MTIAIARRDRSTVAVLLRHHAALHATHEGRASAWSQALTEYAAGWEVGVQLLLEAATDVELQQCADSLRDLQHDEAWSALFCAVEDRLKPFGGLLRTEPLAMQPSSIDGAVAQSPTGGEDVDASGTMTPPDAVPLTLVPASPPPVIASVTSAQRPRRRTSIR